MRCTIYERRPNVCREFEVGASNCIQERLDSHAWPASVRCRASQAE